MKLKELESALNLLPKNKPVLKDIKGSYITLIINETDNVGYDVKFDYKSLSITKFKREPYKTHDLLTGYEKLTIKQSTFIRHYLLINYFPELEYLL